jgi:serine/threonine-protein kinase
VAEKNMSIGIPRPKSLFGYDVVGALGEGTAHRVYVVCHPENGQLYAMKYVARKSDKDLELIDQMNLEFEVTKPIRSTFVRKCVDLKINKKLLGGPTEAGLIMELVDGEAVDTLPLLDPVKLIGIFTQVARGLAAIHQQRYVHCELNPHHIVVSADGNAKVIDLGHVTKIGTLGGRTPGMIDVIAPEQAFYRPSTELTDVYNLGATMYWALTRNRVLSVLNTNVPQWDNLINPPYMTPAQINPQVPEPLSRLVMWCCQPSVGSRPKDMGMVVAGLEKITQILAEKAAADASKLRTEVQGMGVPSPDVQVAKPRRVGVVSHPLDF